MLHIHLQKIAQLTKVVYYLNTKNEDQTSELIDANKYHREEINEVMNASHKIIDGLKCDVANGLNKIRAQELVIASYIDQIEKKDEEITHLKALTQNLTNGDNGLSKTSEEQQELGQMAKQELEQLVETFNRQKYGLEAEMSQKLDVQQRNFEKEVYKND